MAAAVADAAAARAQQLRNEAKTLSLKIDLFHGNETEDSVTISSKDSKQRQLQ